MLSWYPATLMPASRQILGRGTFAPEPHNDSCSGRRAFDRGLLASRGNQIGLRSALGEEHDLARQFQNNAGRRDQHRNRSRRHGACTGLSRIVDAAQALGDNESCQVTSRIQKPLEEMADRRGLNRELLCHYFSL